MDKLLDGVFLLLARDNGFKLLNLNDSSLRFPNLDLSKVEYWPRAFDPIPISQLATHDWDEWEASINLPLEAEFYETPLPGDLIVSPGRPPVYFESDQVSSEFFGADISAFSFRPKAALLFRPKTDYSSMFLADYFERAAESEHLFSVLLRDLNQAKKATREHRVKIPKNRVAQIVRSIELRTARFLYLERIKRLVEQREPFSEITTLYKKRMEAIERVHSEYLREITAMVRPLPFFIEDPYRRFCATDLIRKLKLGQILLNLIVKVPLLLILEELAAISSHCGGAVRDELLLIRFVDKTPIDIPRRCVRLINFRGKVPSLRTRCAKNPHFVKKPDKQG